MHFRHRALRAGKRIPGTWRRPTPRLHAREYRNAIAHRRAEAALRKIRRCICRRRAPRDPRHIFPSAGSATSTSESPPSPPPPSLPLAPFTVGSSVPRTAFEIRRRRRRTFEPSDRMKKKAPREGQTLISSWDPEVYRTNYRVCSYE